VTPAGVVLIGGPEEYLGIRAMDRIRSQVRAAEPDVEITRLNAGSYEPGSLAMNVSPSLFGESKLIEVEAVEAMNDAFLADAHVYLARPEPDAVLVLRHGGGVRGKKLLDAIKSAGWPVVDCQPLKKDADKSAFVASEFRAASRRIEPDAVHALVNAVGANLSELAAACSQLIADAATAVDTAMVDRYYGGRIEATAFKVADAAMAGNGPAALSTLRHALATGADPVPLVAALAAKLRTVAKVAGAQGSSAQIARQLGMQPWLVEQAQRDVRRWTPEGLVRSIQVTAEADAQVKGLAKDPVYAVEHAVTVIATSVRRN
jgi:DNA polymerase-3 subunit delta